MNLRRKDIEALKKRCMMEAPYQTLCRMRDKGGRSIGPRLMNPSGSDWSRLLAMMEVFSDPLHGSWVWSKFVRIGSIHVESSRGVDEVIVHLRTDRVAINRAIKEGDVHDGFPLRTWPLVTRMEYKETFDPDLWEGIDTVPALVHSLSRFWKAIRGAETPDGSGSKRVRHFGGINTLGEDFHKELAGNQYALLGQLEMM